MLEKMETIDSVVDLTPILCLILIPNNAVTQGCLFIGC